MASELRVLCVHGIGGQESTPDWHKPWEASVQRALDKAGASRKVVATPLQYDEVFAQADLSGIDFVEALGRLAGSGIWHGLGDLFAPARTLERAEARGLNDSIRWYAGMVVKWIEDEQLRAELRARFYQALRKDRFDVVLCHSLGTLLSYDSVLQADFSKIPASNRSFNFICTGSQIGNPAVRETFAGRLIMPDVPRMVHFYNARDWMFTNDFRLPDRRYAQVVTEFSTLFSLNHDAVGYFEHANALPVWREIALPRDVVRTRSLAAAARAAKPKATHRALIIGINEYHDPRVGTLAGCVNDAFLMSSVLQERGFPAEGIRLLLNDRATAEEIRDRLRWLLDAPQPGDHRVLHFSGHGAQLPGYNANEVVDHVDECLVPHDFDFSRERAIVDDDFFALYADLPYDLRFTAVFDCCHSGGMTRAGMHRVRGLSLPDDIRHRLLQWDTKRGWIARKIAPLNPQLAKKADELPAYVGESGITRRLGRAIRARTIAYGRYDTLRKRLPGNKGPYLPVLFEACAEHELALEHQEGATNYGAFTYALAATVRALPADARFIDLRDGAIEWLKRLEYRQEPKLLGPTEVLDSAVPFAAGQPATSARRKTRRRR